MNAAPDPVALRQGIRIRTAIFGVYVAASALGFAVLMAFVLQDVERRYLEAMRRTMGDTATLLAAFAADSPAGGDAWTQRLRTLPTSTKLLRVFAGDPADRVLFDSAGGGEVGQASPWPMTGGGWAAPDDNPLNQVALVDGELRVRAPVR